MSDISQDEWKSALTSILEELDRSQYKKMLECLTKIPKGQKTGITKEKMPQKIIEIYGIEDSVVAISKAMNEIPRKDPTVQDLLRPFVDKLKNKHEKENKGQKRKSDEMEEERRPSSDQEKIGPPDKEKDARPWKKSISDLKSGCELGDTNVIAGKVVQKSGLRTYRTKDGVQKPFFYVAVADETDSIKMMVYGKTYHKELKEEKSYLFRNLIRDDDRGVVKVTTQSKVSETSRVQVPEELEMEARKLIYSESPLISIAEAKSSDNRRDVSVEGTVTEIDPIKQVKVHDKQRKVKKRNFQLRDDTGSIRICMWDEETKQCKRLSVGDVIKVTNLKTNKHFDTISLSSTTFTSIHKLQSVGIQNARIEIIGIMKATKKETHLEAEFNQQVQTFVVASQLLAQAFDFKLDDLKETLLEKMPLQVDAVIQGNKIKKITSA